MAGFKLQAFGGFVPRVDPTLLQDNEATKAINTKLYSGSLKPWYKTSELTVPVSVPANTKTVRRERNASSQDIWFAWGNDVDVVSGPLTDTNAYRMYYTGDGYPKKTNETLAGTPSGSTPASYLSLGVPAPVAAPTVARVGSGSTSAESRVYAYTYISEFGDIFEESAPSAASSVVTVYSGDSVTVAGYSWSASYSRTNTAVTITESSHGLSTGMAVYLNFATSDVPNGWYTVTVVNSSTYTIVSPTTPTGSATSTVTVLVKAPEGKYNITKRRIYRSVSGTGSTQFQFVTEIGITTTTYSDTKTSAQLGEVIDSSAWSTPPSDLAGLVELPNGILAGFVGNEVFFSEPYYPHAWPLEYAVSVGHKIVGLGVFGQSLVAVTEGNPYIISGVSSASMSSEKVAVIEPCVSKRTIASDANGVTYASPNGIMEIGPGGPNLITRNIMLKEEFSIYSPSTAFAKSTQSQYFMFYQSGLVDPEIGVLIFDRNVASTPLTLSTIPASAAWVDNADASLYVVGSDNTVLKWEGDTFNRLPFEWTSKEFVLPEPVNMGAIEILADYEDIESAEELQTEIAAIIASNQAIFAANSNLLGSLNNQTLNTYMVNGSLLAPVPQAVEDRFILIIIYADGIERHRLSATSRGVYRLPAGYKSDLWQFTLNGNIPLRHVKLAETVTELKSL
jgi:hypothetical protein